MRRAVRATKAHQVPGTFRSAWHLFLTLAMMADGAWLRLVTLQA